MSAATLVILLALLADIRFALGKGAAAEGTLEDETAPRTAAAATGSGAGGETWVSVKTSGTGLCPFNLGCDCAVRRAACE
jgi:hypothetical protein